MLTCPRMFPHHLGKWWGQVRISQYLIFFTAILISYSNPLATPCFAFIIPAKTIKATAMKLDLTVVTNITYQFSRHWRACIIHISWISLHAASQKTKNKNFEWAHLGQSGCQTWCPYYVKLVPTKWSLQPWRQMYYCLGKSQNSSVGWTGRAAHQVKNRLQNLLRRSAHGGLVLHLHWPID